jgi:hypothetical protein
VLEPLHALVPTASAADAASMDITMVRFFTGSPPSFHTG